MALTYTPQAQLGSLCPDFTLPGTDLKSHSLKEFQNGKPLVVMFICNHCPYVKAIEDRLIQLGQDLRLLNVNVVAICSNDSKENPEDNFENLKKRADEKMYSFVYLHDPFQDIARKFDAVCTPDFFVFDGSSKLAYRGRLDDSWKDSTMVKKRELYEAVEFLLRNQPAPAKQIPSMGCNIKWTN